MTVKHPVPISTKVKIHPGGEKGNAPRTFTVTKVYDHFALAEDKYGIRQCILNADLVHMGLARE